MTSREFPLNAAACRLLQNIMPGLETAVVFQEKVGAALTVLSFLKSSSVHTLTYLIKQIYCCYTITITTATDLKKKKPLLSNLNT